MEPSVWKLTLEEFAQRVADGPTPAGVSVCAVAAGFALKLLAMSLNVTARRRDFGGDRERYRHLVDATRTQASQMMQYADEDIAAYKAYLRSRNSASADAALREAIEVPIKVARAAIHGLELCNEASSFVSAAVAPDLSSAAALLGATVRAAVHSAEANAAASPDRQLLEQLISEWRALEVNAAGLVDRVFSTAAGLRQP